MRKPKVQQRTERRISAALRLVMVAVLLLAQIALVIVLSDLLKQRMALAYTVLQLLAGVVAMRIWSRPGATSYKMGWIILVLFVPVVGLILYLLWNGDRPSKRLSLKKPVPIEEPLAQQELARTNLEKLRKTAPQWYPLAAYLSGKGFDLYRNTALRYLPTGEAYLEDMLTTLDTAQRFIFLEYFIMAEGEIWVEKATVYINGEPVELDVQMSQNGDTTVAEVSYEVNDESGGAAQMTMISEDGDFDGTTFEIHDYTVEGAEDGSPNADDMVLESSDGHVILAPEGIEPIDLTDELATNGAATGTYEKDGATYVYQVSGEPGNWHASVHLEGVDAEASPSAAAEAR